MPRPLLAPQVESGRFDLFADAVPTNAAGSILLLDRKNEGFSGGAIAEYERDGDRPVRMLFNAQLMFIYGMNSRDKRCGHDVLQGAG